MVPDYRNKERKHLDNGLRYQVEIFGDRRVASGFQILTRGREAILGFNYSFMVLCVCLSLNYYMIK